MATGFKLSGLEEFKKAMAFKSTALKTELPAIVTKVAKEAQTYAKKKVPKDSHTLEGSIEITGSGLESIVETHERYSHFVEFGTARHGPEQPYMRPAQKMANGMLIKEVLKVVKKK